MKNLSVLVAFLLVEIASALFIFNTRTALPAEVASHFNAAGAVDSFMPAAFYTHFMLGMVIGVPCIVTLPVYLMLAVAPTSMNLPNRGYWLNAENRARTGLILRTQAVLIGILTAGLLDFVHWLVILANRMQPPVLPQTEFLGGMAVFLVVMLLLVIWPLVHFSRVPRIAAGNH